jgi:hypothetical protein
MLSVITDACQQTRQSSYNLAIVCLMCRYLSPASVDDNDSETNGKEKFTAVGNCLQVIGFKPQVSHFQLKPILLSFMLGGCDL